MAGPERKRRIAVFVDDATWKLLREHAFNTQGSMSEYCYEAIVSKLRDDQLQTND